MEQRGGTIGSGGGPEKERLRWRPRVRLQGRLIHQGRGHGGGPIHPFRPDNYLMRITSLLPSFFTPLASHFAVPWPSALPAKPASDRGFQRPRLPRVRKLPADTFLRLTIISIILRIFTFIPCHPCQWRCGVVASGQTLSLLVLLKCGVGGLDPRVPCVYIIQL